MQAGSIARNRIMKIEINPNLDVVALRDQFQQEQKLRIENFLTIESAEYILENLKNSTSWHMVHSDETGLPVRYGAEKYSQLTDEERKEIEQNLHRRATNNYQYMYRYFPIIDAIKAGALPESSMLFEAASFFNSTEFIGFGRALTEVNTLVKVDPQATLYESGHFLTTHDDSNYQRPAGDQSTRRFAVVLGFTKNWSANWGGQTSFFNRNNPAKTESWNPSFNVLTIFKVPVLHCVNFVTPFAGKGRYSITGWLRDDPTIKRPDLGDV